MQDLELTYLKSLSKQFPTIADAATEIINLQAILSLPKGTEHFLTDIHGEYEQFNHVLKNGSGSVKRKIDEEFGNTLSSRDKRSLATLIYYPMEKLELVMQEEDNQENLEDWFKITLHRLVQMTKRVASKYTRSKVRKALPKDFSYVIEELITEKEEVQDKEAYYNEIIHTIIRIGRAPEFIAALCNLIQRLVIDHLHIVGDIYDRGNGPHIILDTLSQYHSVDIQWGNHDVVWMGAASGQTSCIANIIRISARYGNLDILEEGYGINLIPLATFAMNTYADSDCDVFSIKYGEDYDTKDLELDKKMHKAIAIIQFKLEGQLIKKRPEFDMADRLLLDKINYEKKTVTIGGTEYAMKDVDFPTVDPKDPYRLTPEEEQDAANYIFSEGKRLESLSFKLLDILVLKKKTAELQPCSPAQLVGGTVEHLRRVFAEKNIVLQCRCEEGMCMLEPDLVKSLLVNLLDNARKAMDGGGNIYVVSEMLPDGCRIRVLDTGRGIPQEEIAHITEAFYRVDKSRSRAQGGVGLGLSLCSEIVQLHNGTMSFASRVGNGTCVTVELKGGAV